MDSRHKLRLKIVQELFSYSFKNKKDSKNDFTDKTNHVIDNLSIINDLIKKFAPKFPIDKISRVDLAIMQLGVYEMTIEDKEPIKVIINEAVELAKELGSDRSYSFINAVLGKINTERLKKC